DEIEFMDPDFRRLYVEVVNRFNLAPQANSENFIPDMEPQMASAVSQFLMDDEKYTLSNWERKEIYVKTKEKSIAQMVSETILNLRRHLVSKKINELSLALKQEDNPDTEAGLQEIVDYISLKKVLSQKLNRVL